MGRSPKLHCGSPVALRGPDTKGESQMRQIANIKSAAVTVPGVNYAFPVLLGVNTLVLMALERAQAIPSWVKLAAALFLEF